MDRRATLAMTYFESHCEEPKATRQSISCPHGKRPSLTIDRRATLAMTYFESHCEEPKATRQSTVASGKPLKGRVMNCFAVDSQ
tara:strand:+ start:166 stop:417 length:252 start_codon:yes stop_codon:yes gene_type:complete